MAGCLKLYYFNVRARAEPLRMSMAFAGKKYDDVRLTGDQWSKQKGEAPFGLMPYISYNGKCYGESKALASYIARECGLAGKTSEDALRVDEVYCLTASLLESLAKAKFEKDEKVQTEMGKTLAGETIPKYMGFFEKMLKETGTGYFVGKAITLADLTVYDITCSLRNQNDKVLDKFPEIQKMRKNVEGNTKVKAYLDSRPDCNF